MAFYTGSSPDGSDIREVQGMFVSPDGNEWSNIPYPPKSYKKYDWKKRINNLRRSKTH